MFWLDWLANAALKRGDWITRVYALSRQGWTLTLTGRKKNLISAKELLLEAWECRNYVDLGMQDYITKTLAALCIRQELYTEAHQWLNLKEELVNQANFDVKDKKRYSTTVPYYRAEIFYLEGDYQSAKSLYEEVCQQASKADYQRRVNYAQNRLAEIAMKEGNFEEAEKLLQPSLDIAHRNKDQRLVASYQRSYAYLENERGNMEAATDWATKAIQGFTRFGMVQEEDEMRRFLLSLISKNAN